MAGLRVLMRLLAAAVAVVALASPAAVVSGQQVAGPLGCTTSLVTSFAPCLNFIINSTASPTADCCRSLGALMKASTGCACLILTGSVPLGVPVNRTMAVTLPRACNNASVPLQCQDATTSAQTPAPGPVADAPAPSFLAPLPPVAAAPVATPVPEAPAPGTATATPVLEPTNTPPVSQGETRPTVVYSSAWRRASAHVSAGPAAAVLLFAVAGAALV